MNVNSAVLQSAKNPIVRGGGYVDASGMKPPRLPLHKSQVIVTTGNELVGMPIVQYLGVVRGIIVRSPGLGRGISGSLRALSSGNIPEFVEVCEETRQMAFDAMLEHAVELGANAVIGFRYDATEFSQGISEVLAYGTAVQVEKS